MIPRITRIKENMYSSKEQIASQNKALFFRQLVGTDIHDLIEAGFPHDCKLKQPLTDRLFQHVGFRPLNKGLVAYQTQEKKSVGFLQLVKHRKWLYSIRCVFTHPNFRRMGVASGLFDFAFSRARGEGGRKIFLNVFPTAYSVIGLYSQLGFDRVAQSYEVRAYADISKSPPKHENKLKALDLSSESSRKLIFGICQSCMGDKWIDFFETDSNNLADGFSGSFKHFAFKQALVSDSINTCALVFKRPMTKIAHVELFAAQDSEFLSILDGLILNLHNQGINHLYMKLFNINDDFRIHLLKKRGFYRFHSIFMGKHLLRN